jgi:hypothetical protein
MQCALRGDVLANVPFRTRLQKTRNLCYCDHRSELAAALVNKCLLSTQEFLIWSFRFLPLVRIDNCRYLRDASHSQPGCRGRFRPLTDSCINFFEDGL